MHSSSVLPSLPPAVAREVLHTLRGGLPLPVVDSPEALLARDEAAMAVLAALRPGDALEASLAADIVAAGAHAKDCFRLAVEAGRNADTVRRYRAQAAVMMRVVQSGLRSLQRTQALREKAVAAMQSAAMEQAGWWFRDVSVPSAAGMDAAGTNAVASPDGATAPAPAAGAEPVDAITAAEQYAAIYPERAACIRADDGLPRRLDFAPPEAAIVAALINGTSPILKALDDRANRRSAVRSDNGTQRHTII